MKTSDFDYSLPPELIAQEPPAERGASRMLVLDRHTGGIEHRVFSDFLLFLQKGDVLVVNDTKVIPARLFGVKEGTGGRVDVLLTENISGSRWKSLIQPTPRMRPGTVILLAEGKIRAVVGDRLEAGGFEITMDCSEPLMGLVERYGTVPLPPYIKRDDGSPASAKDRESYQTVYAANAGAVAAPTAGLHFTAAMLALIKEKGVLTAGITLHVGPGTFKPVKAENLEDHKMDPERYIISEQAAGLINSAKREKRRIIAVGTTAVRTLESACNDDGTVNPGSAYTSLFVYPPYRFRVIDALLTNFHLPKSTLMALVSAFCEASGSSVKGRDMLIWAYEQAVAQRYRFYSYGDCMLVK